MIQRENNALLSFSVEPVTFYHIFWMWQYGCIWQILITYFINSQKVRHDGLHVESLCSGPDACEHLRWCRYYFELFEVWIFLVEVTAPLLLFHKLSQSKHGHRSRDVLGEGACWFWGAAGQPEVMDELLRNASLELHMCSHATCIKQRSQQEPRSQASSHRSSCESQEPQSSLCCSEEHVSVYHTNVLVKTRNTSIVWVCWRPRHQGLHLETGTVFVFDEESIKLILILFTETVSSWEKLPAALLVHLPHIGFLASVLCLIFVDQIHHKE